MQFDARIAKSLEPGKHLTFSEHQGLRLSAGKVRRTWHYRFKSPVDGRMRQIKIGEWPSVSLHAAVARWEVLRKERDSGVDPSLAKKEVRTARQVVLENQREPLTVRRICTIYLEGHIKTRAPKGQAEVQRVFRTMLADIGEKEAVTVTRKIAFDTIKKFDHIPVQAGVLRRELGAAWDYCLDSGILPEETMNWWRTVLRGKLKSKGFKRQGEQTGVTKRVLSSDETGKLLQWLPHFSKNVCDFLTLYLWTAVRGAEIERMEGKEVAHESTGIWWTIPKHKTKKDRKSVV